MTQQNSALVEQNAATAKALEHQSQAMDQRVSFFRLDDTRAGGVAPVAAIKRAAAEPARRPLMAPAKRPAPAAPARHGGPVGRVRTALATAVKEDADWKEF